MIDEKAIQYVKEPEDEIWHMFQILPVLYLGLEVARN